MPILNKTLAKKFCRFLGRKAFTWLFLGVTFSIGLAGIELSMAALIQLLLKSLNLLSPNVKVFPQFLNTFSSLGWIITLLICIGLIRSVCQFFVLQSAISSSEYMNERLRNLTLYEMLLHPRREMVSASEINLLYGEIFPKTAAFCHYASQGISVLIQALVIGLFLFVLAWKEALFALVGLAAVGAWVWFVNQRVRKKSKTLPLEQARLLKGIERIARNWLLVKILRTNQGEYGELSQNVRIYSQHSRYTGVLVNMAAAGTPLFGVILLTIIIFVSQKVFFTESLKLVSFLYLFLRLVQTLASGVGNFGVMNQYWPQLKHAWQYFLAFKDPEISTSLQFAARPTQELHRPLLNHAVKTNPPAIEINKLAFTYPSRNIAVLKELNIQITPGKQLGIIGPSGSGKSTLLSLILGLLQPDEGHVLIDNIDAHSFFSKKSINIGYVGPEPFLIKGSILENLKYGCPHELTEKNCWDALRNACLQEVITTLPEKLNFQLSENGEGLSAGQKQRLALARAFAMQPTLLILDEASANLDKETETAITENIHEKLNGNATCIIVSHRPGILKYASNIIELGGPS